MNYIPVESRHSSELHPHQATSLESSTVIERFPLTTIQSLRALGSLATPPPSPKLKWT
jgi:hypothetical protein